MSKSVAVIVGAGPGVSAGVARKFGSEGFKIVLLARRQESLDEQVSALQKENIEAVGITADASKSESLTAAFTKIKSEYGVPEVLVYNAGANSINNPSVLTEQELLNDFQVNVAGALVSSQQVIPEMIERKSGTILFTGGALALNPVVSRASAAISKAGLRNLTFTLAEELAPQGIHVGTVTIGGVVKAGTFFDPEAIADAFWNLYEKRDTNETLFKPE
ncbi:SDR family NAD(P)-dependent oxidoreductase [Sporosarcina sp. BI001-red]|uniref:SDR family NAD(P)-dependent oxidoreductase n=1 Tax=Sporosarcina sp. BI001-red TaxID=2282866 RepID=UPI000E2207D9|nr:SDR family NAD(P)-dependent oxidoreductase [Sporosarcina sp. BI001-red]REB05156.1 SDR family NAD(P)-dependent oxidoreductase [Sporosarcina sp. BI001-red]